MKTPNTQAVFSRTPNVHDDDVKITRNGYRPAGTTPLQTNPCVICILYIPRYPKTHQRQYYTDVNTQQKYTLGERYTVFGCFKVTACFQTCRSIELADK